jgi:hypothetical protein
VVERETPDLARYWFEFDVDDLAMEPGPPGVIRLDGGNPVHHFCWLGVGVTGYDEADCTALIAARLAPHPVPPIRTVTKDIDLSTLPNLQIANPAWRGIWMPPLNRDGPVIPGA